MAGKLILDLDYIKILVKKSDENINKIRNLIRNINNSKQLAQGIVSAQEICAQFSTIGENTTEANTYGWARIGCLISYVKERFNEEKDKTKTWETFAEECFPKIKARRRQQAVRLYEFEKEIPRIVRIYFLGIDSIVPLLSAVFDNEAENITKLFEKFEIDLSSRYVVANDLNIRKKIESLTKYLNTASKTKNLSIYEDLIIRATKVGCQFTPDVMSLLEKKAQEDTAGEYLRRCIANKTTVTDRIDADTDTKIDSIFCLLSKIQQTCGMYYRKELYIPECLSIDMINNTIEGLENIKSKIEERKKCK